jgi:hypothetical protein
MFTNEELDTELGRRLRFPPFSVAVGAGKWETTTVEKLKAELDATPIDHEERKWRQWELALAERQRELHPNKPFRRVVEIEPVTA